MTPTALEPPPLGEAVGPTFFRPDFPLEDLRPSPLNPRKTFDEAKLRELAENVRTHGVLQPLVVRAVEGRYEIVCGERRFRAAKLAGLATVPATVRPLADAEALEIMVIENNQREDVNPLEEADGFARLLQVGWQAEQLATRLGRSKKYVYDRVKLLELVPEAKQLVLDGVLTAGHAILLARQEPKLQRQAIDPTEWELFIECELAHVDGSERQKNRYAGKTVASVREFAAWIDEHARIDLKKPVDAELFPDAAAVVQEQPEKVLSITLETCDYDNSLSKAGILLWDQQWKRADGTRGHNAQGAAVVHRECDRSAIGVVVIGRDRGKTFKVCVDKTCDVHWKKERTAPTPSSSNRQKVAAEKKARERQQEETRRWLEKQARENAEREQLAKAAPQIFAAFVSSVKLAKLADVVDVIRENHAPSKAAAQAFGKPATADDHLRLLALDVLSDSVCTKYPHPPTIQRFAKQFGVNLKKLLPAAPVQTSAQPAKAKKGKKRS